METTAFDVDEASRKRLGEAVDAYAVMATEKRTRRDMGANEEKRILEGVERIREALQYQPIELSVEDTELAYSAALELAHLQRRLADMRRLSAAARADLVAETDRVAQVIADALGLPQAE